MDDYLEWLVLCFIGEPGGYGMGVNRRVFFSNVGAPIALRLIRSSERAVGKKVEALREKSKHVKAACSNEYVARRFEMILDELGE